MPPTRSAEAVRIASHPFIEFAGLTGVYINACHQAQEDGIDLSECSRHTGLALPLHPVMSDDVVHLFGQKGVGGSASRALAGAPPYDGSPQIAVRASA
jgi:hypothetical protein